LLDIKNLKVNLEQKILSSDKVIVFPHRDADFDAIGSSIGMSLIAKKFSKENHILMGDPIYKLDHGVQTMVEQVKDNHQIIPVDQYRNIKTDNTLNVLCDVSKPKLMYITDFKKDNLVLIDHHDEDSETFDAGLKHIDNTASSASEIVTALLCSYKIKIPADIANILLTGVLLDTNRLSKNVSSDTMRIVTKLLESGATMEKAGEYFTEDFNSDRKIQELVSSTKFLNYTVAIILANEDREYSKEELAKAADYLLKYKVDAAFAVGNIGDGIISVSARSKDSINVGNVMRELEGGGNQYSGATKLENTTIREVGEKLKKIILPNHFVGKGA
jgi:c-di-AMP phosphodiesterase-like protein